jgi:hypothetical protein
MDLNEQKQQFSVAFIRAVAAVCGLAYATPDTDDDSIDATIALRGGGGSVRSPKLDLQLKCSSNLAIGPDFVSFVLPVKNYDELRPSNVMVPRILVVVAVHDTLTDWLKCSESEFAMRKCAYWLSLRDKEATPNSVSVTVQIPRRQQFDPPGLTNIFDRLKLSGLP